MKLCAHCKKPLSDGEEVSIRHASREAFTPAIVRYYHRPCREQYLADAMAQGGDISLRESERTQ